MAEVRTGYLKYTKLTSIWSVFIRLSDFSCFFFFSKLQQITSFIQRVSVDSPEYVPLPPPFFKQIRCHWATVTACCLPISLLHY